MRYYDFHQSPYGRMLLVADGDALCGVYFEGQKYFPHIGADWRRHHEHAVLNQAKTELAEYFGGKRERFEIPIVLEGTTFQKSVWDAIAGVRFGETITYGELALRAGSPAGVRAAGAATGRNPLTIVIPCHRIVGTDGSLTGYAGGLERKTALLALESRISDLLPAA